jgi:hypothetical protein
MRYSHRVGFYLFIAMCLNTVACTGLFKNYGQINPKAEITKSFESHDVNPNYRYYTTGPDLYPNAVMGLQRDYTLDPRTTWKEVMMTPEKMKEFVMYMYQKAWVDHRQALQGFEIMDNNGKSIGVWYSILRARTFVRMQEEGTINIPTPNLEIYNYNWGRSDTTPAQ